MCVCHFACIYIYKEKQRERETERDRERQRKWVDWQTDRYGFIVPYETREATIGVWLKSFLFHYGRWLDPRESCASLIDKSEPGSCRQKRGHDWWPVESAFTLVCTHLRIRTSIYIRRHADRPSGLIIYRLIGSTRPCISVDKSQGFFFFYIEHYYEETHVT